MLRALNRRKGFTLVELMLVMTILGMVLAGFYMIIDYAQKSYALTEAQSIVQDDINNTVRMIGADIRSARKPNQDTKAVHIPNGRQINVYSNNGTYKRVCYRLNPADRSVLQRGWVETTAPGSGTNPDYGTISNWEDILRGIVFQEGGNQIIFFSDITPAEDEPTNKRVIQINIKATDEKGHIADVEMPLVFSTRSKN